MFRKICFLVFIATSLALKSPVLIWSSSRGLSDLPQSYTGQTIESEQFSKSYLKPLTTKNNLVVFVQDRLSLQDLNEHADVYNPYSDGGAFKNIKSFMEDQFSVQIPSVVSPWTSLEKMIKDFEGKIHKVKEVADLSKLDLDNNANLIIVSLKPVQGSSKEGETFADNDVKMAEVTKHLTKRGVKFTAMYTGKTASKSLGVQTGVSRRLQAVNQFQCENCTFVNVTCAARKSPLYFYMRSVQIFAETDQKKKNLTTKIIDLADDGTTCDNDTAILKLKTPAAIDGLDFKLEWHIMKDNISEYWTVTNNTVTVSWNKNSTTINTTTAPMDISSVLSPKDFSYHCSYYQIKHVTNGTEANITLTFDGLQLQPFGVIDDKFSDGWDCVVFFTPGIWMAIISTLLMILIVLFGLNMIASLKTMDRYDDPKGKTITVNVNE